MRSVEIDTGTMAGTIAFLPSNYSLDVYGYVASNSGTAADDIVVQQQQFNTSGTITGTVTITHITVPAGDSKSAFNESNSEIIIPPGGYVTAYSTLGTSHLTLKVDYVLRQV